MTENKKETWRNTSPLDAAGVDRLTAHVVDPGKPTRIFGYDVAGDLAEQYSFAEVVLLALTGELPDAETGRAFEKALCRLAPVSIAEAPAHGAALARLCGAGLSGIVGIGAMGLAEQARAGGALSSNPSVRSAHNKAAPPESEDTPSVEAAAVAELYRCGLQTPEQIEAALVIARLPCLLAEALAVAPGRLAAYPVNLPPFQYEE